MDQYDNDYSLGNVIKVEVEKLRKQCRHFQGIQHGTCKAGVDFRKLAGGPDYIEESGISWPDRLPCQPKRKQEKGVRVICKRFEYYSEQEIEDQKNDLVRILMVDVPLFNEISKKIREKHNIGNPQLQRLSPIRKGAIAGVMECPKCQSVLVYEISGRNTVKINCKTPDCLHLEEP